VLLAVAMWAVAATGYARKYVVDTIDYQLTGATGAYIEFSGKSDHSRAVYKGYCGGSANTVQLNTSNSKSGIVSTESGGRLSKVIIKWNSSTTYQRKLSVYGSHSAYAEATYLYNGTLDGDLIQTVEYTTPTQTVTISADKFYEYVGIRANDGALYLDRIEVVWEMDTLKVSAAGYATYYSDPAWVVPTGVKAGVVTSAASGAALGVDYRYEAGATVPGGTGVLVQAEAGEYPVFFANSATIAPTDNLLKGAETAEQTTGGDVYYKFAYGPSGTEYAGKVGFYWGAENGGAFTSPAGKAYLALSSQANAPSAFLLDDEEQTATAMEALPEAEPIDWKAPVYNLMGMPVREGSRGWLLQNGKKYFVR